VSVLGLGSESSDVRNAKLAPELGHLIDLLGIADDTAG